MFLALIAIENTLNNCQKQMSVFLSNIQVHTSNNLDDQFLVSRTNHYIKHGFRYPYIQVIGCLFVYLVFVMVYWKHDTCC